MSHKVNYDEWIKALESGDYNQSRGYLSTNTGFCCLGVLCEVLGAPKKTFDLAGTGANAHYFISDDYYEGYISREIIPPDMQEVLTRVNDGGGDFNYIAGLLKDRDKIDWGQVKLDSRPGNDIKVLKPILEKYRKSEEAS